MYTGGWEIVGKNKKDKNPTKSGKLNKVEKKKLIENAPRVEDFLPLDQVKSLYDNLQNDKENRKPLKEIESKIKGTEDKRKQRHITEKKKEEGTKNKLPKSIEDALDMINVTEVQSLISTNQQNFPDAPLIWLKTLAAYLNSAVPVDKNDPFFLNKPDGYPLNVVPKNLRATLEKTISTVGSLNAKIFYEYILTAMAIEMTKNVPVIGYKILLQLLVKYDPKFCMSNIAKLISMRNSYQNRKPIGLSLLWCFNQGGREDLNVGLKVWLEVMAPLLEAKNYSFYILQLLDNLTTWHGNCDSLQAEIYLDILDFFSGKLNTSTSVIEEGFLKLGKLRVILFHNKKINHQKLFESLLAKVTPKTPPSFRDEMINALVGCLNIDDCCFLVWKSLCVKHLYASTILLTYIDSSWYSLETLFNSKLLLDIFSVFQLFYEKSRKGKGKDDQYLFTCSNLTKEIYKKMSSKKSDHKCGFPWKTGCFLVIILVGAIAAYDIHKHGSFDASNTGKFLNNNAVTINIQKTWVLTKLYHTKCLEYLETNFPEQFSTVVDFSMPYFHLAGDFYLVAKNLTVKLYENVSNCLNQKYPVFFEIIEMYIPVILNSGENFFSKTLEIVKTYSEWITEQTIENSVRAARYLKTNVFVGKLSPESIKSYAFQAINTTHTFASLTYDWVYEKVQTLSKVE